MTKDPAKKKDCIIKINDQHIENILGPKNEA